jgi:hypothetical protein
MRIVLGPFNRKARRDRAKIAEKTTESGCASLEKKKASRFRDWLSSINTA